MAGNENEGIIYDCIFKREGGICHYESAAGIASGAEEYTDPRFGPKRRCTQPVPGPRNKIVCNAASLVKKNPTTTQTQL